MQPKQQTFRPNTSRVGAVVEHPLACGGSPDSAPGVPEVHVFDPPLLVDVSARDEAGYDVLIKTAGVAAGEVQMGRNVLLGARGGGEETKKQLVSPKADPGNTPNSLGGGLSRPILSRVNVP